MTEPGHSEVIADKSSDENLPRLTDAQLGFAKAVGYEIARLWWEKEKKGFIPSEGEAACALDSEFLRPPPR